MKGAGKDAPFNLLLSEILDTIIIIYNNKSKQTYKIHYFKKHNARVSLPFALF